MASKQPNKSTITSAKTEDSQSDPNSQDASQGTGLLAGQMANTFKERAKKAVSLIAAVIGIGIIC